MPSLNRHTVKALCGGLGTTRQVLSDLELCGSGSCLVRIRVSFRASLSLRAPESTSPADVGPLAVRSISGFIP